MSLAELYTKDYFENQGGSNYTEYIDWPFFKERAEWLLETFYPKNVLEIGCAKGFMINHLLDLGVHAYGYDISEYAISQAKHPSRVHVKDITKPFEIPADTLVVSFDVLEHLPIDSVDSVIANLKHATEQFHMITTDEYDFHGDHTHFSMHPKQWWIDKFEEHGVKNYTIIHAGEQEEYMK